MSQDGKGLRFNEGKIRYDLIPSHALEGTASVFTFGSKKYGDYNWKRGMSWSNVLASLERHLQAIKKGQDYDPESGLLHISHLTANAMILGEYYKIYPQGDNRSVNYKSQMKIGLDLDDVCCDFMGRYMEYNNMKEPPTHWNFNWDELNDLKKYPKEFWMDIKPKINPKDIGFEPKCYITSRHCDKEITLEWLKNNNFPSAPLYHLGPNESKLESAKKADIDIFVDDKFETFVEFNKNGILCFLMDAPHNKKYDVGFKRIYSLKDL
jgi:5'(3')-deoxyribonucleotidase